jgi:hypothetical protein
MMSSRSVDCTYGSMQQRATLRGCFLKRTEGSVFHHKSLRHVLFVPQDRLVMCYSATTTDALPTRTGTLSVTYGAVESIADSPAKFRLITPSTGSFVFETTTGVDAGAEVRAWVDAIASVINPRATEPASSTEGTLSALQGEARALQQRLEAAMKAVQAAHAEAHLLRERIAELEAQLKSPGRLPHASTRQSFSASEPAMPPEVISELSVRAVAPAGVLSERMSPLSQPGSGPPLLPPSPLPSQLDTSANSGAGSSTPPAPAREEDSAPPLPVDAALIS